MREGEEVAVVVGRKDSGWTKRQRERKSEKDAIQETK